MEFRAGTLCPVTIAGLSETLFSGNLRTVKPMLFVLCFCYCFFTIVLGIYLGVELISVRKGARMARTLIKAARAAQAVPPPLSPEAGSTEAEPNYFTMK